MTSAFAFGTLGNVGSILGSGWSIEEHFAWAVGDESALTLPLSGDDQAWCLRVDLHPAIFAPDVTAQRLTILAGEAEVFTTTLTARVTLDIDLPADLTAGQTSLSLRLLHPDAARPSDHGIPEDQRPLAVCFHSARLMRAGAAVAEPTALEPFHGVLIGHATATRLSEIAAALPCFAGKIGFRAVTVAKSIQAERQRLPPGTLETASFVWIDLSDGLDGERSYWDRQFPRNIPRLYFHTPRCRALWPFDAQDPRNVFEPGRYPNGRYPYGDRIAQSLAMLNMADDVIWLMYEMAANTDPVNLDALLEADRASWQANDAAAGIALAPFIDRHFRSGRPFFAPAVAGPALMQELARQVFDATIQASGTPLPRMQSELDTLMEGYVGWPREVPVLRRVAEHFQLPWWSPDMTYRWFGNRRTARDHVLGLIRWNQWRP